MQLHAPPPETRLDRLWHPMLPMAAPSSVRARDVLLQPVNLLSVLEKHRLDLQQEHTDEGLGGHGMTYMVSKETIAVQAYRVTNADHAQVVVTVNLRNSTPSA